MIHITSLIRGMQAAINELRDWELAEGHAIQCGSQAALEDIGKFMNRSAARIKDFEQRIDEAVYAEKNSMPEKRP